MQQSTVQSWAQHINDALSSLKADIVSGFIDSESALNRLHKLYDKTPRLSIRVENYDYLSKRSTGKAAYNIALENKLRDLVTVLKTAEEVWKTLELTFPEWATTCPNKASSAGRFDDLLPDAIEKYERMLDILSDPMGFMCEDDEGSKARRTFSVERITLIGARDKLLEWIMPSANTTEAVGAWTDAQKQERETQRTTETKDIGVQLEKSLNAFQGLRESWDEFASVHKDWETKWSEAAGRFDRWDDILPTQIEEIERGMEEYRQAYIDGRLPTPLSSAAISLEEEVVD